MFGRILNTFLKLETDISYVQKYLRMDQIKFVEDSL